MLPDWQPFAIEAVQAELHRLGRQSRILYFGDGTAADWLREACDDVTAIDHDASRASQYGTRCENRPYYHALAEIPNHHYDLILVDGVNRNGCIRYTATKLKPRGLLLLDDAQRPWYKLGIAVVLMWDEIPGPDDAGEKLTRVWRKPSQLPLEPPRGIAAQLRRLRHQLPGKPHGTRT